MNYILFSYLCSPLLSWKFTIP